MIVTMAGSSGWRPGELERGGDVAAAGDAAEDAFLGGEAAGGVDALLRGGRDDAGEVGDVEVPRHEAVADALDAVMAPLAPGEERALGGLHGVEAYRRVLAAEIAAHAGDEAARALRVHEGADLAGAPPICSQISGPVDSVCASMLSGLSNWPGTQ